MSMNKVRQLVNALDALSDDVKDMGVVMCSVKKPTYVTSGSHAGLISIVAKDLPELQDIYKNHLYFTHSIGNESDYHSVIWADVLAVFLGFIDRRGLEEWAQDNPKFWGNERGIGMFCCPSAFTDDTNKQLIHRDIINHWKQVLVNIEA